MKPAIHFSHVCKEFYLQEEKTFKDLLPTLFSGKSWAKKHTVFQDLSFTINPGETVGIVGRNGAGKSTILKLIAKVTAPTSGRVEVNGKVAPLIELGAGFHHELTGYENIFLNAAILGMKKKEADSKVQDIIAFSGLEEFIHTPVKRYSSGMYMRLGFSVAIHTSASILLVDEVLAVGDKEFQQKSLRALKERKHNPEQTIIFVSHDEDAVKSFCDRALFLENGAIVMDGRPHDVFASYDALIQAHE